MYVKIDFKFISFASAGYIEVHFNKINSLLLNFLIIFIAFFISWSVAEPVDKIIGLFFFATFFIKFKSVISKDEIL